MDNMGMDTFLSLVRTQNVSHTAKELNLAQSTVSKRLKQLEDEVGHKLFDRSKGSKSFLLTPAGARFIDIAENWQYVWNQVEMFKSGMPDLNLSIGILPGLFPELLQRLDQHRPKIKLDILTSHSHELYGMVERKQVDVAFSLRLRSNPVIRVEECYRDPMVIIKLNTPANAGLGDKIDPADLNPDAGIYLNNSPDFQKWHNQLWPPYESKAVFVDETQMVFTLLKNERQWSIVAKSSAKLAQRQTGNYLIYDFKKNAPPPRICYKLTHRYPRIAAQDGLKVFEKYLAEVLENLEKE